jgi:chemotaxis signal transduction protein
MIARVDSLALIERIRELEVELARSWKRLGDKNLPESPQQSFHALVVGVGSSRHLIPVDHIREVVAMAQPSPLADAPDWVLGEVVFGGQAIPVVDLASRLGAGFSELSPSQFLVICDQPRWLGLMVSWIGDVIPVEPRELISPGSDIPFSPFVLAAQPQQDGSTVHLLSVEKLGHELGG